MSKFNDTIARINAQLDELSKLSKISTNDTWPQMPVWFTKDDSPKKSDHTVLYITVISLLSCFGILLALILACTRRKRVEPNHYGPVDNNERLF